MLHIDWLLTHAWEVWLDEIFDKYFLTQLAKIQHVPGNICFNFFFSSCYQVLGKLPPRKVVP